MEYDVRQKAHCEHPYRKDKPLHGTNRCIYASDDDLGSRGIRLHRWNRQGRAKAGRTKRAEEIEVRTGTAKSRSPRNLQAQQPAQITGAPHLTDLSGSRQASAKVLLSRRGTCWGRARGFRHAGGSWLLLKPPVFLFQPLRLEGDTSTFVDFPKTPCSDSGGGSTSQDAK